MLTLRYTLPLINELILLTSLQFLLGTIERAPDLYLDELQEMLAASCGHTVSKPTIWHTLRKTGFTMKKDPSHPIPILTCTRLSIFLLNAQWRDVQTMLLELQDINQGNLSLLTRALFIAIQHIVAMPGRSKIPRHNTKHSLFMVDGVFSLT